VPEANQTAIRAEMVQHCDIIQAPVAETYNSLTVRHLTRPSNLFPCSPRRQPGCRGLDYRDQRRAGGEGLLLHHHSGAIQVLLPHLCLDPEWKKISREPRDQETAWMEEFREMFR